MVYMIVNNDIISLSFGMLVYWMVGNKDRVEIMIQIIEIVSLSLEIVSLSLEIVNS